MKEEIFIDGLGIKETDRSLINKWDCYASQVEARKAFREEGKYDKIGEDGGVIINDNPTGAGKTMTWLDPAIRNRKSTIVLYPTNALIKDQYSEIKDKYLKEEYYDAEDDVGVIHINSDVLQEKRKATNFGGNQGELISLMIREERRDKDCVIALTNPDIFVNIRNNIYTGSKISRVLENFETIIVDEFHHASLHGKGVLLNLIEQIRDSPHTNVETAMLLSATPDRRIMRKLSDSNAYIYNIANHDKTKPLSQIREEDNCEVSNNKEKKSEQKESYRVILPKVKAEFRHGQTFQIGNKLISPQNLPETLNFIREEDKTVIMLDGQKEVTKVKNALEERLENYKVIQVDGKNRIEYNGNRDKITEFNKVEKAVMVSNSAVEVGINFETDNIIFSGTNPSKMLQRFGRLRNKATLSKAIIYCPKSIVEYARDIDSSVEDPLTREKFQEDAVEKRMTVGRKPSSYHGKYGAHAAYRQALKQKHRVPPEEEDRVMEDARKRIEDFFFNPYYMDSEVDWERFKKEHKNMDESIMQCLKQYRSGTPSLLVYDTRTDRIMTHEIQSILRTGDVDILPKEKFIEYAGEEKRPEIERKEQYTCGYVVYRGTGLSNLTDTKQTERKVMIRFNQEVMNILSTPLEKREPKSIDHLEIELKQEEAESLPHIDKNDWERINKGLEDFSPVVFPIAGDSYSSKYKYGLDDFFFLSKVNTYGHRDASLAIGHNALYLHSILQEEQFVKNPKVKEDLKIRIPDDVWEQTKVYRYEEIEPDS